jgi:hypothetical protein
VAAEQPGDLSRHQGEDLVGVVARGDDCGDTAEAGLFSGERPMTRLRLAQGALGRTALGHVFDGADVCGAPVAADAREVGNHVEDTAVDGEVPAVGLGCLSPRDRREKRVGVVLRPLFRPEAERGPHAFEGVARQAGDRRHARVRVDDHPGCVHHEQTVLEGTHQRGRAVPLGREL